MGHEAEGGGRGAGMVSKVAAKKKPAKKAGAKPALGKNGKPKKKKKAKDPNKPKRAMVAFMYFSIDQRPEVPKRQPELKIADVSKVLGERWRNMSAAQKAKYASAFSRVVVPALFTL